MYAIYIIIVRTFQMKLKELLIQKYYMLWIIIQSQSIIQYLKTSMEVIIIIKKYYQI